jgi:hypothetical protein
MDAGQNNHDERMTYQKAAAEQIKVLAKDNQQLRIALLHVAKCSEARTFPLYQTCMKQSNDESSLASHPLCLNALDLPVEIDSKGACPSRPEVERR